MAAPSCKFYTLRRVITSQCSCVISSRIHTVYSQIKHYCTNTIPGISNLKREDGNGMAKPDPFWTMMENRLDQASRSLLFKVPNNVLLDDVLQYVSARGGSIAQFFPHSQKGQGNYVLIEFHKDQSLKRIHKKMKSGHLLNLSLSDIKKLAKSNENVNWPEINRAVKEKELAKRLSTAKTVSEQLELFYKEQMLQEPEIRLRFLLCVLLEGAFHTVLPDCHIYPFGSSVNGFGKRNCDVDMYLDRGTPRGIVPVRRRKADSYDLRYDKQAMLSDRIGTQLTLQTLATYLKKQVPHCYNVYDILHATCPLIKFRHHATGLSCDLTGDNRLGLTSSELLYVYGHLDTRVPHLVFLVRHWAHLQKITNNNPGYWITNFPLTLLVIFFLQTRTPPVVPSLDYLFSIAGTMHKSKVNTLDTSLVRDISSVPASTNTQSSECLLQEFFHFCTTFDFEHKAISVRHGKAYPKPDNVQFSLYIENPLETHLNASKNVKDHLVKRIRERAGHALQIMTQSDFASPMKTIVSGTVPAWGVPLLFLTHDEAQRRADSVIHMLSKSLSDADLVNEHGVVKNETQESHHRDTLKTDQLPLENECASLENPGLDKTPVENNIQDKVNQQPSSSPFHVTNKLNSATDEDKILDMEELTLEFDGMYTSLVYLYGQKHNIKVNFTFTEENVTSEKKIFKAECRIGNFVAFGSGKTKRMAKHQAAKLMLLNLPVAFVRKHLK